MVEASEEAESSEAAASICDFAWAINKLVIWINSSLEVDLDFALGLALEDLDMEGSMLVDGLPSLTAVRGSGLPCVTEAFRFC